QPVLDALPVDRRNPRYCRVTFDHPPINTITATTVAELSDLVASSSRIRTSTSLCSIAPTGISTLPIMTNELRRPLVLRTGRTSPGGGYVFFPGCRFQLSPALVQASAETA